MGSDYPHRYQYKSHRQYAIAQRAWRVKRKQQIIERSQRTWTQEEEQVSGG